MQTVLDTFRFALIAAPGRMTQRQRDGSPSTLTPSRFRSLNAVKVLGVLPAVLDLFMWLIPQLHCQGHRDKSAVRRLWIGTPDGYC